MAEKLLELELETNSVYRGTKLFIKGGRAFLGLWNPPDVRLDGDEPEVTIPTGLDGHLDIIADAVYGDRQLWRVIAHVNRIDFPLEGIRPGTSIIIPKPANVKAALEAAGAKVEGAEG